MGKEKGVYLIASQINRIDNTSHEEKLRKTG